MNEHTVTIGLGAGGDFFRRGREIARRADRGEAIPHTTVRTYEDPADLLKVLTAAKLRLYAEVKARPGSIADLARRLQRDRSAVKRDVDDLERAGVVTVAITALPGHGRQKHVRPAADHVRLEATL